MRLLLSSYYYPPSIGGVEHQSHLLASGMTQRGHSVRVISARLPGFKTDEVMDGVHIHRVSRGRGSRWQKMATYLAGMLAATLRARAWADVIQVQQILYPAAAMAALAPVLRRPLVVRNAGSGEFGGVQLMHRVPLGRAALTRIARVATGVSLSTEMTAEMREVGFRRLVEIHNGIEIPARTTAQERNNARERLGVTGPIVLYAGRFESEKGVDILLAAWQSIEPLEATLLLVGDGPNRAKLQHLVLSGTHAGSIRFEGPSTNLSKYYQAADIFVMPSRSEGISNALLEAMGYGVAVVATDVGGNHDVIQTQEIGRLVRPGDPTSLAAAIQHLLNDAPKRDATGEAGRAHVQANYSAVRMLDRYESMYVDLRSDIRQPWLLNAEGPPARPHEL